MPLTDFQRAVARIIARNRKPESHVAGGAVLNRAPSALRYSKDLDIFNDPQSPHNAGESVAALAEADAKLLSEAGYSIEWMQRSLGFHRAVVSRENESLRLDWAEETAFRFFPAIVDQDFGYALHPADLATNKVLALAGRSEIRDYLDILELDEHYFTLGAMIWAACGKDEGYTPSFMIQNLGRHSRYQESDLRQEKLARPVDLRSLKTRWLAAIESATRLFEILPAEEVGCLYLDHTNTPVTPDPESPDFGKLKRHWGSVRGAWPTMA